MINESRIIPVRLDDGVSFPIQHANADTWVMTSLVVTHFDHANGSFSRPLTAWIRGGHAPFAAAISALSSAGIQLLGNVDEKVLRFVEGPLYVTSNHTNIIPSRLVHFVVTWFAAGTNVVGIGRKYREKSDSFKNATCFVFPLSRLSSMPNVAEARRDAARFLASAARSPIDLLALHHLDHAMAVYSGDQLLSEWRGGTMVVPLNFCK